jgi:hypothetical protein
MDKHIPAPAYQAKRRNEGRHSAWRIQRTLWSVVVVLALIGVAVVVRRTTTPDAKRWVAQE